MANITNNKILVKEEIDYLKERYIFELVTINGCDWVAVKTTTFGRKVLHDANCKFSINTPIKRITITPEAIEYWKQLPNIDLITIQNVVNSLSVMYQKISKEEILKQIKIGRTNILEK